MTSILIISLVVFICSLVNAKEVEAEPSIDWGIPKGNLLELYKNTKGNKPKILGYTYKNCGSPSDKLRLDNVELRHNAEGDLIATVSGNVGLDVRSPVQADSLIHKKVLGVWVKIPCIYNQLGSCHYNDICEYGMETCPFQALIKNNIPCSCPVSKGTYSVSNDEFPVPRVPTTALLMGEYKFRITVSQAGRQLACYSGTATIGETVM